MNDQDYYQRRLQERKKLERIKRARRKNMIILVETVIIFVLIIALITVSFLKFGGSAESSGNSGSNSSGGSVQSSESTVSPGFSDQQLAMMAEVDKWYLKLVNFDTAVDKDFISNVDRSEIMGNYINGTSSSKYLDSRIVEVFNNMCRAAAEEGVTIISISAYRSFDYQNTLFKNRVQRCINEDNLSREEAEIKAASIVARPGTSEHHLGLAVDINSVEESFANTSAFRWLQKNAEDFGFILRYPKDKQDITKVIYEPWHYRYVGVEHAKAINELGMCLEEYIEYLASGGVKK